MSGLDYAVVAGFLAILLAMGFSAKLREASVVQFLVAGRALTLPAFVATLVSTWYGGILGIGESASAFGFGTWVLMGVPYYVFGVVYALWLAPKVREGVQISIPERFDGRYGRGTAIVAAVLLFLLAVPAAHVLMLGVLLRTLMPLEILPAVVVAAAVGSLFLWRGGLLADVRVALVAFVAMYVGFAVIDVWCLWQHPPAEAFAKLSGTPLAAWDGGKGPLFVASFFLLGAWTLVDPGFHQRVASAATPELGRRGVLVSVGCWVIFDLLSITAGLYAAVLVPDVLSSTQSLERLAAMPRLGLDVLPSGLRALFLCGMFGTLFSAMAGYALIAGATLGREVGARLWPARSDADIQRWSRYGILISLAVAVAVGLSLESVVSLWYSWAGAVVGALLIPLWASYVAPSGLRSSGSVVGVSIVLSAIAAFVWLIYGLQTGNPYLEANLWGQKLSVGTLLPGLAVSAMILAPAQILAIIAKRP